MSSLRRDGDAARQHAGNHHQPGGTDATGMRGMFGRQPRILRPRADDHRNAGFHQRFNPLLSLSVGQQRPVAHRTAIDDSVHANIH